MFALYYTGMMYKTYFKLIYFIILQNTGGWGAMDQTSENHFPSGNGPKPQKTAFRVFG